jgi:hypothetical protein
MSVDTDIFILEVERNPVIWDTSCVEYKDRNKKSAWDSICRSVTEGYDSKCAEEKEKIRELLLMLDVLNKLMLLSSDENYPSLSLSIQ